MELKKTVGTGLLLFSNLIFNISCSSNQNLKETASNNIADIKPLVSKDSLCNYSSEMSAKSEGLKMKISYPCSWTLKDGDRPHVVKKFSKPNSDQTLVNGMLVITKLPGEGTKDEIRDMLSPANLPSYTDAETDKVISAKSFTIDGEIAGELIFETTRNTPVGKIWMKSVEYLMFYKNNLIRLQYMTGSQNENQTLELFSQNQKLFSALATGTVITTKWENGTK